MSWEINDGYCVWSCSADFSGTAPEYKTVGRRLFFPEVYSEGNETLRILNVGENESLVNIIECIVARYLKGL
jgi:hypothetical protein